MQTGSPDHTAGEVRRRAVIGTDRAQRYLDQLARHAVAVAGSSHLGHRGLGHEAPPVQVERNGETATLTFVGLGVCTVTATDDQLTLAVDAADAASAERITGLVTADLTRFSHRQPLTITWQQV
ncbi:MAG: DUF2218 domain-containing protein [Lapillicoccus sp.]